MAAASVSLRKVLQALDADYVDVKAAAAADAKAPVSQSDAAGLKALVRRASGASRKSGIRQMRLRIPYSFAVSCAAGGLCNSVSSVLADANSLEWAGIAALYDEYKVHGGEVAWGATYQTPPGANSVDAMHCVIGYDPVDGGVLSGVRAGTELGQHQLKTAQATGPSATTSAGVSMSFGHASGEPYRFKFETQPVTAFAASSSAVVLAVGSWKIINASGSNQPDGYLKFYGTSDNANPVTCFDGIVYLDVSFRSRK